MPTVYAQEETVLAEQSTQQETDDVEPEGDSTEPCTFDDIAASETQPEKESGLAENQTEGESTPPETMDDEETVSTEAQTEEDATSIESETDVTETLIEEKTAPEELPSEEAQTEEDTASTESETDITETLIEKETLEEITLQIEQPEFFLSVINPHYEGLIDDILPIALQNEAYASVQSAVDSYLNIQDAAEYLRGQMVKRSDTVVFNVPASLISSYDTFNAFVDELTNKAMAYTDHCSGQEGDALQWGYKTYHVGATGNSVTYQLTFTFTYHTSYEQEQALTAAVESALGSMELTGKSDYEKIRIIHDYICDHVDYDYTYSKYSAYDALCTGTAVCQGYAILFYRMCKDAGLSVRIISGIGNGGNHGWNIVRIGQNARETGKYYNVDCTWDGQDSQTHHTYFLKCEADFVNHTRDTVYNTEAFHAEFPMANTSYTLSNSMNVDNIKKSLTVFDGDSDYNNDEYVYTTAEGKPKILVFIQTTCPRSQATVRDISQNDFSDVDLYVVSTLGTAGNAAFAAFISQYAAGNNQIKFVCQGNSAWNEYFDLAQTYLSWSGTENTPTICYIDANDKLQYMTYGQQTANAVRNNIDTYCNGNNSETKAFIITYVLNGGTNNTANPSAYTSYSETITLLPPSREGFTFAGWYRDMAFTQAVTKIEKGSSGNITLYAKWENDTQNPDDGKPILLGNGTAVTLTKDSFTYNGGAHRPEVIVQHGNKTLTAGRDFELTYQNNKNAGAASVTVTGINDYQGTVTKTFTITPAELVITANDLTLKAGAPKPTADGYRYQVKGLAAGDTLSTPPTFTCAVSDPVQVGIYEIIPGGAAAGANYDAAITYISGKLLVAEESVGYIVAFNTQGHGSAAPQNIVMKSGDLITKPADPSDPDYRFEGWYQDAACTKVWNFGSDIVQANITLYAKWSLNVSDESDFRIQEIADMYYTGKACKPAVSIYDGDTLLKLNKDYTITYGNNTNASLKKGNGIGTNFDNTLPYVKVTGKGNYKGESLAANFTILPAMIADDDGNPAKGVTLKYTDQLTVNKTKATNPFSSIKYVKKLNMNTDFELLLSPVNAFDSNMQKIESDALSNALIPAGYSGEFKLTITGKGNYTGTIRKTIFVKDKSTLLKNAKITIGANLKSNEFDAGRQEITLQAGVKDGKKYYPVDNNGMVGTEPVTAKEVFIVTCGGKNLVYRQDFDVRYTNNDKIGTASMTIIGMGSYVGEKTASFRITGAALTANTVLVTGIENKAYTGKAWTQNNVALTYKKTDRKLTYGEDYTISYRKNVNKGTATMTFTAANGSAYSGSFSKTFRITAADLTQIVDMDENAAVKSISVPYEKAGAKPAEQIVLTYNGMTLQNGKDYTISYQNNKALADPAAEKAPTIILKGKGNYAGQKRISFAITPGILTKENITITPVIYSDKKAPGFEYTPTIKVKDNNSTLKKGVDYTIEYQNNTQEAYQSYLKKLPSANDMPTAIITAAPDSNYKIEQPIQLPLPIYQTKFTKNNLYVVVDPAVYSGRQVQPAVRVYYAANGKEDALTQARSQNLKDDAALQALGLTRLEENANYILSYGTNITAGKNKGSVTISGISPYYGGSLTVKFEIQQKEI